MDPSSRITVNGVEYTSWEQVPPDVRAALSKALPDQDGDGIPDLLQGGSPIDALPGLGEGTVTSTSVSSSYTVDGTMYSSAADLPEAVRRALQQAGMLPAEGLTTSLPDGAILPSDGDGDGDGPARPMLLNGEPFDPTTPTKKPRWWRLSR